MARVQPEGVQGSVWSERGAIESIVQELVFFSLLPLKLELSGILGVVEVNGMLKMARCSVGFDL